MFIRKTQVQKKRAGGYYYTYRIVESLRTGKEVRRQILLNLGADFSLPEEKWPILTKRIQEILHGQLSIFDINCKIDKLARNFAAKIIIKQQDKNESIVDYRQEWRYHSCQKEYASRAPAAENIFTAGREESSWKCGKNDDRNKKTDVVPYSYRLIR